MKIEYDENKNKQNIIERGLPFDDVALIDWRSAVVQQDDRKAYPETRLVITGLINERLHIACFTPIEGGIRVIAFAKLTRER